MSQRTKTRRLAPVLVVAALALAGPLQAETGRRGEAAGLWQRLTSAWRTGVSALWEKTGGPVCLARNEHGQCQDPDGGPTQVNSGGPACNPTTEAGGCTDPDG